MNGRNPLAGRHSVGAPIARSGTKPKPRTGSPSGNFVGTGVNRKSAARPQYQGSQPRVGVDAKAEDFINQSPSPWANSQPSSRPDRYQTGPSAKVGGAGGRTGAAGAMTGSAGIGRQPRAREDDMAASGHARGYQYRGLNPINSGRVTTQAPKRNTDNGQQAQARAAQQKFNRDFAAAYQEYKKWGG